MRIEVKSLRAGWNGQNGSAWLLWKIGPFFSLFYSCEKLSPISIKKVVIRAYAATRKLKILFWENIYNSISFILRRSRCFTYMHQHFRCKSSKAFVKQNFLRGIYISTIVHTKESKLSLVHTTPEVLFKTIISVK